MMPYEPKDIVTSAEDIRSILGEVSVNQTVKVIDYIDEHFTAWIARCPLVVIASANAGGVMDVSPKGDPAGFVRVLDSKTLAIPDRLGNRRADTFSNILENPQIALLFIVPKRNEVVRVSGTAQVVKDRELREEMAVQGKVPDLAMIVRVDEAMFHCGKAMLRSHMWQPEKWRSIDGLPSYAQAVKDQGRPPEKLEELEERFRRNEAERMY
jgi:PPOX class probable FMN-dependent enzyme